MAEKLTIFISGTMHDLPTERARVAAAIQEMGLEPVWAEKRGAMDRPSHEECERMAHTCHVYLGLYGLSYGWKFPPEETISVTEFEWQTARRAGKPLLIYRQKGQPDAEQVAFLKKVGDWQKGRFWYEFETLDDLLPRLLDDLARLIKESFRPERPADLADYRDHLRRLYADLPLSGIPVPLEVTLPLDRVYIKLRALPEREEAARRKAALPPDGDKELPRKLAERLWQQRRQGEEEAARRLEEAQPISPEEAIAQHDRLAVLGEAGAGKSTLLRHLTWERAGDPEALLPLLIPLGRTDVLISQGPGCSFLEAALDLLTEHKTGEEKDLLKQALEGAIRDKSVLFLCDGLDEVHLARRSVVAGLEKLAAEGHHLMVTSRPLGYERLAAREMEHFQVLPLLPEDARDFSDRWFQTLAEARGVPEAGREVWAAERAGWLQRQLDERPGLREVARNPLLLTFLAVLAGDDPQRDLPHRRKELYQEYVERLFTVWEARRRQEGELSLGKLRGEEARRVALWGLYCTAWHLHQAYYGDDEGPWAVRDEIEPRLARDLGKRWEFGTLGAEALATEVLRFWERAGLLDVYRLAGQEWLAFRHLTFQEYGAARALAEIYGDDADGLWQRFSPYLLRPQWAGVIPLTLAHLPEAQATTLVECLLAANEGDKDWQRPFFLAAAALAEGAEVADTSHRQVVDALLKLARTRGWSEWHQRASAEDAVNALGRLVADKYATEGLVALGRDRGVDGRVRGWAAEALGELGRSDEATETWLPLARDRVVGVRVRKRAAEALGELGRSDEAAKAWLTLARDRAVGDWVRKRAAEALGELGQADDLLALARNRRIDTRLREQAAEALGRLGRADDLLALARDRWVGVWVRKRAAEALGRLDRADEAAETWLTLARDPAVDDWVRVHAAASLGELRRADEAAELLLALAQDQRVDTGVRERAAKALRELGRADEAAEAWLTLASDRAVDGWVRERAAEALGKLDRADKAAEFLLALARDPAVDDWVWKNAAVALGELGRINDLLALARDQAVNDWVREWAAGALGRLGRPDEEAEAWLALARDRGVDTEARERAAKALRELGRADEATEAWLALAQDRAVGAWERVRAAKALGRLGRCDEAAQFLLALARDRTVDVWAREWAAEALGKLRRVTAEVLTGLQAIAEEPGTPEMVRWTAREALERLEGESLKR